jgi:hypothetical protein
MRAQGTFHSEDLHPIDIAESILEARDWTYNRVSEFEVNTQIRGHWSTYTVTMFLAQEIETLRLVCTFGMRPPKKRRMKIIEAVNLANDKMHSGAFVLWPEENMVLYRKELTLAGGAMITEEQIDAMLRAALGSCEQYYPAFQLVGWGNETPERALFIAMNDAYGCA